MNARRFFKEQIAKKKKLKMPDVVNMMQILIFFTFCQKAQ